MVSGVLFTAGSQAIKVLAAIAATILTARLLRPEDFGLLAMVAPIVAFVAIFQDLGLQQALVQAREIDDAQINRLFWINLGVSAVIGLCLVLIGPPAAWFFAEPRLTALVAAHAAPLLLQALAAQQIALLNRELRFRAIAAIDVAGALANLVGGVVLAWWWRSYWALWGGTFVSAAAMLIVSWAASRWRPSSPARGAAAGHLLRFGLNLAGYNVTNYFARNLDNVIVARLFGATSLGYYDRAYRLLLAPLQNINAPLSRVVLPLLGRLHDQPERYRTVFMLATLFVTLACSPGITALGIVADRFVPFVLGADWAPAAPIFAWLALSGIVQPLGNATGWLFVSQHRTHDMFRWGVASAVITVASFVAGIPWGTVGIAAAYSIVTVIVRMPLLVLWSGGRGPVGVRDLLVLQWPVAGAGVLTYAAMRWLVAPLGLGALAETLVALLLCYGAALAFTLILRDVRASLLRAAGRLWRERPGYATR